MKKKGLIISTVVMVVVLIASLTTATYAWFTASSVTNLQGFDVSVISNNAVNIGVKGDYTHDVSGNGVNPNAFYTGSATFTAGTKGVIGAGSWTSESVGLSATLDPQIKWGAQSAAIGVTTETVNDENTTTLAENKVTLWNGAGTVVKGNKNGTNVDVQKAIPNNGEADTNGDYVHFILGVSPTKDLGMNNFVLVVEPAQTGSSIGVLASIHVAYRITKYKETTTSAWKEVDIYGDENNGNTLKANVKTNGEGKKGGEKVVGALLTAYQRTYTGQTPATGSIAYQISGLDLNKDEISQLEIVIYMAGSDEDCNDQGKTAAGSIKMFFNTQDKSTAPTEVKLSTSNVLTLTGADNATVEYTINNKDWVKVEGGTWTNGKFTSQAIAALADQQTVKVRLTEDGKSPSNPVSVTNA